MLGHGGISRVAELSGLDPKTIRRGRADLSQQLSGCPKERIRRVGAGRPTLKTNIKRLIGKPHPDRDRQYRFIQRVKGVFIRRGQPMISVDAKKTELIGNFKNAGARYCQQADEVNTYDFPSEAEGKAIPYGVYDVQANQGWVNETTTIMPKSELHDQTIKVRK